MTFPPLRTGLADLPHPALPSMVLPRRGEMNNRPVAAEITAGDQRQDRLDSRGVRVQISALDSLEGVPRPPPAQPEGTGRKIARLWFILTPPPSCVPSLLTPYRPFVARMDTLIPARADSAVPGSLFGDPLLDSFTGRFPGFTHPTFRPFRLQPPVDATSRQGTLPFYGSDRDCFHTALLPTGTRGFAPR